MDRRIPEISWIIKHRPKIDPKFHQLERLTGAGKSIIALFTIDNILSLFRKGLFIK